MQAPPGIVETLSIFSMPELPQAADMRSLQSRAAVAKRLRESASALVQPAGPAGPISCDSASSGVAYSAGSASWARSAWPK